VDFKVGPSATSITFDIKLKGDDDPKKILIGTGNLHPEKAEFTLPARPAR
jgi:hypothetical protein